MIKEIIIHVNSTEKTIANYSVKPHGANGKAVHINAHSNVNYELIEKSSGYAPENICNKKSRERSSYCF